MTRKMTTIRAEPRIFSCGDCRNLDMITSVHVCEADSRPVYDPDIQLFQSGRLPISFIIKNSILYRVRLLLMSIAFIWVFCNCPRRHDDCKLQEICSGQDQRRTVGDTPSSFPEVGRRLGACKSMYFVDRFPHTTRDLRWIEFDSVRQV